ncbi:hypothetical protein ASL11_06270 [Paenibacillus sp. Soil750]|nr:hypothetical protein ASL11_06270 [Paenibacillus sp. Soil750]
MINEEYQSDIASVTPLGIRLHHWLYSGRRAVREQWFHKAISSGDWSISVLYDSSDRSHLFLPDHNLELCSIIQFKIFDQDELNQYHSLIEIYKESKKKLNRLKRGHRHGYLR